MTAPVATYILTCQDDTDILSNAVNSALPLGPVWLFDTGRGARYQRYDDSLPTVWDFYKAHNRDHGLDVHYSDITLWMDPAQVDYGKARNQVSQFLAPMYDWIIMLDSDEMLSLELVRDVPELLRQLALLEPKVVTVAPEWLTLWPDARHYSVAYSGVLSHGRIYQPGKVSWRGQLHEHQDFEGDRILWKRKILHFRQLFTNRSQRQNGHGGEVWPYINEEVRPVSDLTAVSWGEFEYPMADREGRQCPAT